jgi:hypothetical protein
MLDYVSYRNIVFGHEVTHELSGVFFGFGKVIIAVHAYFNADAL